MPRSPDIYADPPDMYTPLQLEWKGNENDARCSRDVGGEKVTPKNSGRVKHIVRKNSGRVKHLVRSGSSKKKVLLVRRVVGQNLVENLSLRQRLNFFFEVSGMF